MIIELADRLQNVEDYYFVKKIEQIKQMVSEGKRVINFGIGNPDLMPPQPAIDALVESAKLTNTHGYQPYKGTLNLRKAFSDFYQKTYSVTLDAQYEVLPLLGSKEGILHILMAFVNPNEAVLIPNPGYPSYTSLSKLVGAKIVNYNLKHSHNWYPDFEELEILVSKYSPKLLWFNYPNMPTGTPANKAVFEKLIDFAHKNKILLCHDNPYSLVANSKSPLSILSLNGAKEVSIELNSLSKSFNMAGWRIGAAMGKKEYIDAILRVKSNIDSGMFLPVQEAAIQALNINQEWHKMRNEIYIKRRKLIFKILDKLGCFYSISQEGLFVWAKLPTGIESSESFSDQYLNQKNIFFTPGSIFGDQGRNYIRFSLCVDENQIEEALSRL